jgi:hypothetical protein
MKLTKVLSSLEAGNFDSTDRQRIVRCARNLLTKFETPSEFLWEISVGLPVLNATIKICLDIGLFEKWLATGKASMNYEELSKLVGKNAETLRKSTTYLELPFLTSSRPCPGTLGIPRSHPGDSGR